MIVSLGRCVAGDDMVRGQSGAIGRCLVINIAKKKARQEVQQNESGA